MLAATLLALVGSAVAADPTVVVPHTYQVTYDPRDCATPMCGGYWIRELNRPSTPCADGTHARWCYVSELAYDVVGWDAATITDFLVEASDGYVVVHGEQVWRSYPAQGLAFGALVPRLALTEFKPRPPATLVKGIVQPPVAYEVTPDLRLCPGPMCGGWWLRAVNRAQTTCFDGTQAASCYVTSLDFTAAGWDPADVATFQSGGHRHTLVYGPLTTTNLGGTDYGVLVPRLALQSFDP